MTLYLCGAIFGTSDAEANGWRQAATRALPDWTVLDPMRRDYRRHEDANASAIVRQDLDDIAASDAVLVMAHAPSWGTAMEMREAFMTGKRVLAVCRHTTQSPWLRFHAHEIHATLADALRALAKATP